ncbi:ABC transporter substrate-binding protein [Cytobacillus kochii]|uniref:ABC transporter substrate-binding protein n=1 Tax=Cytobacillus kochii TaxID=859143 RepID=UPI001CD679A7|nr:ABC transporter substrate-binding protein [Cytobacillus kochii]MCA1027395.1 ABC transporter substrate-binding protein [Cytobacillus kochii]MDM5206903.1 ABC transporter substrate-binding protein [Cytobacillus kochii]
MRKWLGAFLLGTSISLVGCGVQDTEHAVSSSVESLYTIEDFAGREIGFVEEPTKIAALSNGDVDIIYSLGEKVVGRPNADTWIKEAEEEQQIGSTHEVNLERIALLKPDVILANRTLNEKDVPSLESLGAEVILTEANSIEDIMNQISLYGSMLNKEEEAKSVKSDLETRLKEVEQPSTAARVLLVYGAPGTYMAALPNSLSGDILTHAGGENIAADYQALESFPQYAQINTERIIEANPDFVMLMTHGNPEEVRDGFIKEMQQNAAWNSIEAVKNGRIEVLPADLFGTNPGTRVVEAVSFLSEKLKVK